MDLCEIIGAKPYIAANLTSVTPMQIRNWMDYCLSPKGSTTLALEREKNGHPEPYDVPFWGVGNENWGGGGNMRPEYYADECRRFATIMNNVSSKVELYACGSNADDFTWTQGVMPGLTTIRNQIHGFAMHYYCGKAGDPLAFTEEEWDQMMVQAQKMEMIIERNWNIISGYDMQESCKLVIDEWGCWHPDGSGPSKGYNLFEQQSTMRDAMVTALTLNIFNRHCEKIRMANAAQLVNNLHASFLAGGEHCITTPTYHVFDMYKEHQGARSIETVVADNASAGGVEFKNSLSVSASVKDGKTLITIGNLSCQMDAEVLLEGVGAAVPQTATMQLLANEDLHAHNTFEEPEAVVPVTVTIDPTQPIVIPRGGIAAIRF